MNVGIRVRCRRQMDRGPLVLLEDSAHPVVPQKCQPPEVCADDGGYEASPALLREGYCVVRCGG